MTMVLARDQVLDDVVAPGNRSCPACGGPLHRWGTARRRTIRHVDGDHVVRPARVRCSRCGVTQVVLPAGLLVRRRDSAETVGQAWRAAARGAGARRAAHELHLPVETVRGWLRSLRRLSGDRLAARLADAERLGRRAGCRTEAELWAYVAHRSKGLMLINTNWL